MTVVCGQFKGFRFYGAFVSVVGGVRSHRCSLMAGHQCCFATAGVIFCTLIDKMFEPGMWLVADYRHIHIVYYFGLYVTDSDDVRFCGMLQNRKNDEVSYEKMLKLKKDLNKAL